MFRSSLFIAASVLALSACQPAADAPEELVVEVPPIVAEEVVEAAAAETPVEAVEAEADHDHDEEDHEDDAHDDHDEHDHDEEDHAEEGHDDHDHDEEGHDDHDGEDEHEDHDDHDHAGGEAHVHGLSELAASLDGATLSVSVEGALANFGLDESLRTIDDPAPYASGTVAIIGGDCAPETSNVSVRPVGDHGNMMIDLTYACGSPDNIEAIDVTGFASFEGFEQVDAVFLSDTGQVAESLTGSDTRLDLK